MSAHACERECPDGYARASGKILIFKTVVRFSGPTTARGGGRGRGHVLGTASGQEPRARVDAFARRGRRTDGVTLLSHARARRQRHRSARVAT